ncbi:S-adenosyl-L-methionine-dependent methyltransferase [Pholiota conissans]|uniref:S-adenosyl-L-methionine-dependent methyltransferase n=1 Tax=Pholiota conissans TaxID=109636 RepID=A0A9P5Z2R2_9AGAR|nr:S-adenosyl-L-methionine-dependent methyltransferase [Pholiota conissans]
MDTLALSEHTIALHKVNADAYEKVASTYHNLFALKPTATRVQFIQDLAKDLAPGSKVLELGCGSGVGSKPFIERGCEVTGVEISAAQIALARENIPTATLVHADMMAVSFLPESFDAVVGVYSFLHLSKDNQEILISRIAEWLKPGGSLACNFPAETFTDSTLGGVTSEWLGEKMFWHSLGADGNRELLKEHGKGLKLVKDEVVVDTLDAAAAEATKGSPDEAFHWIRAIKE